MALSTDPLVLYAYKAPKDNKKRELWKIQKEALKEKFPTGWNPPKRLSPDALDGIRHLHQTDPARFTTAVLAEEFKTSPEAIRRILKSKWTPSGAEVENRRKRWERRHDRIWSHKAELGLRPFVKRAAPFSDSQKLYKDE
ncbi:Required for respiratory growth protein 9 mitochondrial [Penicillium chermesinum]|uniref:Required for respiratory growth protein 9, mitochondrial n=1 Tax=Penicillium chermesinum TaxID=63820 RepID=A0A9W9TIA6_9EURO|nr:Required for respiratory growth protein 9 mitochondrial [Penicillium chermesinum]KAJ5223836.1 Required for respiratory growth protein 9 mitochondrial [Penicillium chermesinum]